MLGSRFLKHDHQARHGAALPRAGGRLRRHGSAGTNARCGIALRFRLATLVVAVADAGRHGLPVRHHADRLHPQPGQRLHVRASRWLRRTSRSIRWPSTQPRRRRRSCARDPGCGRASGVFVVGGNQAFMFAHMKPREERTLSVDQIIERTAPEDCRQCRAC